MSVIEHYFGLKKRSPVRRFRQLLSLDALHEANIRTNPLPYLERASERVYQIERALFEASEAAKSPACAPPTTETIEVNRAEYHRLVNCRSIVDRALARLTSSQDDT